MKDLSQLPAEEQRRERESISQLANHVYTLELESQPEFVQGIISRAQARGLLDFPDISGSGRDRVRFVPLSALGYTEEHALMCVYLTASEAAYVQASDFPYPLSRMEGDELGGALLVSRVIPKDQVTSDAVDQESELALSFYIRLMDLVRESRKSRN